MRLWEVATGKTVADLGRPGFGLTSLAFSPAEDVLAVGSADGGVHFWDVDLLRPSIDLPGHEPKEAWAVAFAPDSTTFATSGDDGRVRLWDTATGEARSAFQVGDALVSCIAFSSDGRTIAAGDYAHQVCILNLHTKQPEVLPLNHGGNLTCLAFSPDGNWLVSSDRGGEVKIYDVRTKTIASLPLASNFVRAIAFVEGSKTLVTAEGIGILRFWDFDSKVEQRPCWQDLEEILSLNVSPDGKVIATGNGLGIVKLWDVDSGEVKLLIRANRFAVKSLAFSPDGKTLVTGGGQLKERAKDNNDTDVKLWDPETGRLLLSLNRNKNRVNAVAFSPDGSTLVSTDHDGTVRMWKADDSPRARFEKVSK